MIKEAAAGFVLVFAFFPFYAAWAQNDSMATELTVKERAFCRLIIEGTKTAAYRKVYSDRGSPATTAVAAYKLSKKPKIKQEVARLLRQREFPADNYARIRDVAVAGLTEIFLQEPDPRLRAKVGSILLAYADAGLKLHPVPTDKERRYDELIRMLDEFAPERQGVVAPAPEPLKVEPEQADARLCQAESSTERSEGEMPRPLTAEVSESVGTEEKFVLTPIPGTFPRRFKRIRVPG
jgi:hypothetical protein